MIIDADEVMGRPLKVYKEKPDDPMRKLFVRVQSAAIENASKLAKVGSQDSCDAERQWLEGQDQAFDDVMLWMIEQMPELRRAITSA